MAMNCKTTKFLAIVVVLCLISMQANAFPFGGKKDKAKNEKQPAPVKTDAKKETLATPTQVVSKARIEFDANSHDFGTVDPDSQMECKFKFKNVGTEVLKIDHLQGTCKCTVPDLSKKEFAPGESGEITVQFHAPKYHGATSQHITVFSNDAEKPRADLEIKAYVKLAVQINPDNLNLSLVDANQGATPITIASSDNDRFAITKIESTGNVLSFDYDPNQMSDKYILKPVVNTAYLRNNLSGAATITINHPKCKDLRLTWNCLKEFEASPSVIIIRNALPNEVQKRSIYLTSNYNQPIVIDSVKSDKGIVKVANQVQTENRFQFDVDITPPVQEGQLRVFSDTLHIKIKDKEEISIPCRGFYKIGQ